MKKIVSIILSICIIFSMSLVNASALSVNKQNYIPLEDGAIWAEIEDDTVYVAMVSESGSVNISKADFNDKDNTVYHTEFSYQHIDSNYSDVFWHELVDYANNSRIAWEEVEGINHYDLEYRSAATNQIVSDLQSIYGTPQYTTPVLKKTDSSTYPGYTFRVYETLTYTVRQQKTSSFNVRTLITDIATSLIQANGLACAAVSVVGELCDMYNVVNTNGAYIAEAKTIITFRDTAVKDRYVTVNGGNVAYSEAYKKDTYASFVDGLNFTVSAPIFESTAYYPSSTIYNDATFAQLIRLAYNAYI